MSAYREHALQQTCATYLGRALPLDATWTSVDMATDQHMDVIAGARRKSRGLRSGWPDVQAIWRGQFYGIELKIDAGKQSDNQCAIQAEIERAGGKYAICRSVEDVEAQLIAWGFPLRAHTMMAADYDTRRETRIMAPKKATRKPRAKPTTARGIKNGNWSQRPPSAR
jgi:hypothetical protein